MNASQRRIERRALVAFYNAHRPLAAAHGMLDSQGNVRIPKYVAVKLDIAVFEVHRPLKARKEAAITRTVNVEGIGGKSAIQARYIQQFGRARRVHREAPMLYLDEAAAINPEGFEALKAELLRMNDRARRARFFAEPVKDESLQKVASPFTGGIVKAEHSQTVNVLGCDIEMVIPKKTASLFDVSKVEAVKVQSGGPNVRRLDGMIEYVRSTGNEQEWTIGADCIILVSADASGRAITRVNGKRKSHDATRAIVASY